MNSGKKFTDAQLISRVLPVISKDFGWKKKLEQYSLFDKWQKIVDAEVFEHATPLKISQNVLWVEVENSAWIQQLQFQKLSILQAVNEFLPGNQLDDIRLVVKDNRKQQEKKEATVQFIPPPPEAVKAFEDQAATIQDEKSREALIRFWYLCHACIRE